MEERVSLCATTKEPAIIAHPFGTSERGCLHIVSGQNDRNARLAELSEAHALIRTDNNGIRLQSYNALYIRLHRTSTVYNLALDPFRKPQTTLYILYKYILSIAHPHYSVRQTKIF